jgi:hypothetical protein
MSIQDKDNRKHLSFFNKMSDSMVIENNLIIDLVGIRGRYFTNNLLRHLTNQIINNQI